MSTFVKINMQGHSYFETFDHLKFLSSGSYSMQDDLIH